MGRIIILRHGQTTSNVTHKLDTQPPGAELTTLGREQAYAVGQELAELLGMGPGSFGSLGSFVCSTALRAQQTAMIVAGAMEEFTGCAHRSAGVRVCTGIHEISAGEYEMRNDPESHRIYAESIFDMYKDPQHRGFEGAETAIEFQARFQPVLKELAAEPRDALVVSHGAAMRVISKLATGVSAEFAARSYIPNCRYIIVDPAGQDFGKWTVERWGDHPLAGDRGRS